MQSTLVLSANQISTFQVFDRGDRPYQVAFAYVMCKWGTADITLEDGGPKKLAPVHLDQNGLRGMAVRVWGVGSVPAVLTVAAGPTGFTGDLQFDLLPNQP